MVWKILYGIGAAWFLFNLIEGFPGADVTLQRVAECVKQNVEYEDNDPTNLFGGQNTGFFKVRKQYTVPCLNALEEAAMSHRRAAFLFTPIYFFMLFAVRRQIIRSKKEEATLVKSEIRHKEIMDTVKNSGKTEIYWGNVYRDIQNSIINFGIIAESDLKNAIQNSESSNSKLAEAIGEIAKIIARSGSNDAADHLNALTAELSRDNPRKSLAATVWERIKEIVPVIKESVDTVETINEYLSKQ